VRLPRNAAYCAAWNSGFLTTFSWSSGSRNSRGELAHSDAGVKKYPSTRMRAKELPQLCRAYISLLLSLKGSVASYWLCADDFRSFPTRRQSQSPSGLHICAVFGITGKAYLYSIIASRNDKQERRVSRLRDACLRRLTRPLLRERLCRCGVQLMRRNSP
jgi:hypothetical protein